MKKIIFTMAMFSALFSFAQEEETPAKSFSISGSVDAYYRANINSFNRDYSDKGYYAPAPGSSFANDPGFALGMANVVLNYEGEKVGAVADLVFGPRGNDAVFNSIGSANIVNQLYVYWNVSDKVTLTFGNWNTFLGYEVISPVDNFNYSTSYMFSYGPFSHTGIKADFALDDSWSAMLAVMNPTDWTEYNPFGTYTLGAQLGYSVDAGSAYLNFIYGDQDGKLDSMGDSVDTYSGGSTFQVDLTAGLDLTDTFYLGLNTTYNTTASGEYYSATGIIDDNSDDYGFYGVALYAQLALSDTFALGVRPEYFSEFNGGAGAIGAYDMEGDANVFAFTLSGNVKVGDLKLIPELRLDSASEDAFLDNDFKPQGSLGSFILAAVYSF